MTLAHSILPVIRFDGHSVNIGRQFVSDRPRGDVVSLARVYTSVRDVDELVLLDVRATIEKRGPSLDLIRQVSETCFVPLVYGGGIAVPADAGACIEAGAERVVICSAPILNVEPLGNLITAIAQRWGSNAVTVSVDFRRVGDDLRVVVRSGTLLTSMLVEEWAARAVELGAGEVLLQAVDRDGMMGGYDLDATRRIRSAIPDVRLIVSGGCGTYEHMAEAIDAGADAVASGSMFVFTESTPQGARAYLAERGYLMRPATERFEMKEGATTL